MVLRTLGPAATTCPDSCYLLRFHRPIAPTARVCTAPCLTHEHIQAVEGNTEKAQRVTIVCNQNLGVYLYEKLVHLYSDQTDFLVMQTGEHSLDLRTMRQ